MIIDGKKVLYSVKAKKLVYPEIPTEGLVCYLDARGKTNTDKHKGTLIDLSGNGNHGTLQNFNFTDGSGYENGGLKFDGVDDKLRIINALNLTTEFTIATEFTITRNNGKLQSIFLLGKQTNTKAFVWVHYNSSNGRLEIQHDCNGVLKYGSFGVLEIRKKYKLVVVYKVDGVEIHLNDKIYRSDYETLPPNTGFDFFNYVESIHFFEGVARDLKVYNKALQTAEIQRLIGGIS